jgi:hypothetical protein
MTQECARVLGDRSTKSEHRRKSKQPDKSKSTTAHQHFADEVSKIV